MCLPLQSCHYIVGHAKVLAQQESSQSVSSWSECALRHCIKSRVGKKVFRGKAYCASSGSTIQRKRRSKVCEEGDQLASPASLPAIRYQIQLGAAIAPPSPVEQTDLIVII